MSCSDDKSIRLWDLKTGLCQKKLLNAHEKFVVTVSMSPKCKLLASGSNDLTINSLLPNAVAKFHNSLIKE